MNYKKWIFPEVDKELVSALADDLGFDPLLVLIAVARGMTEPYEIEQYVQKEPEFCDPYQYSGMTEAVQRIKIAGESGEKVLVFGDYDCDGVTATALMVKYLKSRNYDVIYAVPEREGDGYGISKSAIDKAAMEGVTLIITVDNGISAIDEVDYAQTLGIDVVVTDHHLPQGEIPNAAAVVDPHIDTQADWIYKDLCGVGVAFKLICALEDRPCEEMIYEYADLIALGTVADAVPLTLENRIIVDIGLMLINRRQNKGIKALAEVSGAKFLSAGSVAFTICPRINAAGRMASADIAVKLLLCENSDDATYYAECLDRLNNERQVEEADIFESACEIIEKSGYYNNRVIVVAGNNWRAGIIGIVASKLLEKYGKPCIVISLDGDESKGSGRSINGFSLFDALCECSSYLVKFGGHSLAAGLTVKEENIDAFRKAINEYAFSKEPCFPEIKVDCKIKPRAFNVDTVKALKSLEPYGVGNQSPLFAVMNSEVIGITPLASGKHIRLRLKKENYEFSAVLFGTSPEGFCFKKGSFVDIAVALDINVYNDTESVSVIIKAIRSSDVNDDEVVESLKALENLNNGRLGLEDVDVLLPGRDDIATVFRFIKNITNCRKELIENSLLDILTVGKINIALKALTELGIINCVDGVYSLTSFSGKADLDSAEILKTLNQVKGR